MALTVLLNSPVLAAGRMQSTGHTGTQLASLQQFWVIT